MKWLLMGVIRVYQKTFSPDHGLLKPLFSEGFCRFYPSCSQYGHDCISRFGSLKGTFLMILRILRCNPFSKGGMDPVPNQKHPSI